MRPQNPIDKWIRNHQKFIFIAISMFAILTIVSLTNVFPIHWREVGFHYTIHAFMGFYAVMLALVSYGIYWGIKHPYKPEFCKECKRALPEKYSDE